MVRWVAALLLLPWVVLAAAVCVLVLAVGPRGLLPVAFGMLVLHRHWLRREPS